MQLGFKTKLKTTLFQQQLFAQHAGFARWVYNWGLATMENFYQSGVKLSYRDARKFYTNVVKPEYPWMTQMSSRVYVYAFEQLKEAYKRFFNGIALKPTFKKKGKSKDSFTVDWNGKVKRTDGKSIKLPAPLGIVCTFEQLPSVDIKKATISHGADGWYISFNYEIPDISVGQLDECNHVDDIVGVDLGINSLAVAVSLNTVKTFDNPKKYRKSKKQLARLQRQLQRKTKGSKGHLKAKNRLARYHKHIADTRSHTINHMTTTICKNHAVVVIENLNVEGMMQNHKLAGAVADCGFGEIERQFQYKTQKFAHRLIQVDRFYPSSQLCPKCGAKQKMPLNLRTYKCDCGYERDRDENAAFNLCLYGWEHNGFQTGELPGSDRGGLKLPTAPVEAIKE
ncbi:RNA-guided endonuclease InsQ/TnpB family protein [Brasilonema bromeliae]|uniref:Transposase n=1 Tax=Brasilonema bromeliae SPC951 TaxID=385972 RepID=A0ABX1P933_9CYAN|nr:RNA-guided endonuclease TnpB family protein [Brasilonema bromeliae]NMG20890.1 transposase [Brasilonema bromeliae SPC951]